MSKDNVKKPGSLLKQAAMQICAGGSAGLVEVSIMHPLDLVKTRFQIQRGPDDPNRYSSLADCFKKMYRTEGFLGFYKGILPPILAETPKRAVKFCTFEQYKRLFMFGSPTPNPLTFSLAGLCSGLTEAVVINPFEVVKVRLQADRQSIKVQPSTFAIAREIISTNGYGTSGLNKGITATLGRHGVWNMAYFGIYFNIRETLQPLEDARLEFIRRFGIGLFAGFIASCTNIPFDVAKSRIQGPQPVKNEIKYRYCFATLKTVYKEEGFTALYKGLVPKVLRLGPGGAIMLMVYEQVYAYLKDRFGEV